MSRRKRPPASGVAGVLAFLGLLACGLSAAGFAGAAWWPLELAAHFRVQYLAYLAVAALLFLVVRRWRWAGLFALFAAVNLGAVAPLYVGGRPLIDNEAPLYRAMLINVETSNEDHHFVEAAIAAADPDVVVLQEVNERWLESLERLRKSHPHSIVQPRSDNFGIAMFSKHKLRDAEVLHLGPGGLPSLVARIKPHKIAFTVVATHPVPPTGAENARSRNQQLESVGDFVREQEHPVVLLGDLNVTPWSPHFRRLLERGGLRDASDGRGVQPTWPAGQMPLRIPIDHCLFSDRVAVVDKQVGADVGSDHLPVLVDFQVHE